MVLLLFRHLWRNPTSREVASGRAGVLPRFSFANFNTAEFFDLTSVDAELQTLGLTVHTCADICMRLRQLAACLLSQVL